MCRAWQDEDGKKVITINSSNSGGVTIGNNQALYTITIRVTDENGNYAEDTMELNGMITIAVNSVGSIITYQYSEDGGNTWTSASISYSNPQPLVYRVGTILSLLDCSEIIFYDSDRIILSMQVAMFVSVNVMSLMFTKLLEEKLFTVQAMFQDV